MLVLPPFLVSAVIKRKRNRAESWNTQLWIRRSVVRVHPTVPHPKIGSSTQTGDSQRLVQLCSPELSVDTNCRPAAPKPGAVSPQNQWPDDVRPRRGSCLPS